MNRFTLIRKLCFLVFLAGISGFLKAEDHPDIVIAMADDIGLGDIGLYRKERRGKASLDPPLNSNKLIRQGMWFSDAHSPASLCAPTRDSITPGNYSYRNTNSPWGVWSPLINDGIVINATPLSRNTKKADYNTTSFRKWGFGGVWNGAPDAYSKTEEVTQRFGFDYSIELPQGIKNKPHINCVNRECMKLQADSKLAHIPFPFSSTQMETQSKNIIIIFTDDQGYEDLSCFGSRNLQTPNIDRMAKEGLKLTSFYVASSVCSPSRAALLTGRMPKRVGVPRVLFPKPNEGGLPPDEVTIAELLKEKEYQTALVGKWHLGHDKEYLPLNQGFDSYYGIPYSNNMSIAPGIDISKDILFNDNYTQEQMLSDIRRVEKNLTNVPEEDLKNKPPLMRGNEIIEYPTNQTTLTERYTKEAISFIEKNKEKPFFLYLAHSFPHVPVFVGDKFKGSSGTTPYYDALQEIDWSVGEILNTLKKNGLDKNTVVIFTSDNGPNRHGSARPLKGRKFTTYEGGQRVPAIIWAPGEIEANSTSDEIVSSLDLFPTIANYAGISLPKNKVFDGYDMSHFFSGKTNKSPRKEMYFYSANTSTIDGIRYGDYKFLYKGHRIKNAANLKGDDLVDKLYDIKQDASEQNNLIATNPKKAKELIIKMKAYDAKLEKSKNPKP
ncbi:Arylsulfatase A [Zobellia uliginosa]|uniref:Arylsulfatase A n=1 Tax=Zobellia uliginosa TaxID=143224 RepID=A0ABY1KM41_9FLAO|nr:sulfatase [Zobellia uliginosa]SIS49036.1 Arylsulfatase A [Zobellia uliginosa]